VHPGRRRVLDGGWRDDDSHRPDAWLRSVDVVVTAGVLVGFGIVGGVTTVLFGFGGGFVTVPVVYALTAATRPDAMHAAVGTSAAVMLVNAAAASVAQYRAGRLRREYLWPLAGFVGIGATAGAAAALAVPDGLLHGLFVVYLGLVIVDGLARRGFVRAGEPRRLGRRATSWGGMLIGAVAALLGVGGSVLTVPLLRRRGLPMADSVAMANPLSLPVALAATAVFTLVPPTGGARPIDPLAVAALLAGSLPAIALAKRLLPRLPDRVHAVAYLILLTATFLAVLH
jgi:hypothetical protein